MAAQPGRPQSVVSSPHWYSGPPAWDPSYLTAGLRAGLIALVLLAALAVVVLF